MVLWFWVANSPGISDSVRLPLKAAALVVAAAAVLFLGARVARQRNDTWIGRTATSGAVSVAAAAIFNVIVLSTLRVGSSPNSAVWHDGTLGRAFEALAAYAILGCLGGICAVAAGAVARRVGMK